MAKLIFGLSQSLDGYVDHLKMRPGPALFRHFVERVRDLTGSVYGRRTYEIMRYWDEDLPEWDAEERDFAAADSGDRAAVMDEQALQTMAFQGQDVTELSKMMPGFANSSAGITNTPVDSQRVGINGSSALTYYAANGKSSGTGAIALLSDGADVIDKGCNCSDTQTIGNDMTAEVKVTSSAYSAENTHGPVIFDAIGRSGSSDFHGDLYYHFRDSTMNSNQAYNKQQPIAVARPYARYNYPGGSIGGPVLIPGTNFNKSKNEIRAPGNEAGVYVICDGDKVRAASGKEDA